MYQIFIIVIGSLMASLIFSLLYNLYKNKFPSLSSVGIDILIITFFYIVWQIYLIEYGLNVEIRSSSNLVLHYIQGNLQKYIASILIFIIAIPSIVIYLRKNLYTIFDIHIQKESTVIQFILMVLTCIIIFSWYYFIWFLSLYGKSCFC